MPSATVSLNALLMKILFITANRLGDAVLSTGVLSWLASRHPQASITIVCGPHAAGLFRAAPGRERLIVLRKERGNLHWLRLWKECAATRWDIIVDLRNSVVSRLLRARVRACRGAGSGLHKVAENARVLQRLLAPDEPAPCPAPTLWIDEDARKAADRLLPSAAPLLALGPAANWACKQWPADRFGELARRLTAPDGPLAEASVMVFAQEHERASLAPLLNAIPQERLIEIIGQPLPTVAACLARAAFFAGNDSGLMHMAAAAGVPTLGLFGPGQEELYAPWGPRSATIRTPESRDELLRRLPFPGADYPNLMESLTVDAVAGAAKKLLS